MKLTYFQIRLLDVSHNKLEKISPFAFTDLPKLRILLLNSNLLETLPSHAFTGMYGEIQFIRKN